MNKILLVCVMLCTLILNTACQTPIRDMQPDDSAVWGTTEDGGELFLIIEHEPEFSGGMDSLYSFLNKNIHYPEKAIERKFEGKVYAQFIVEKDGSITNAQIVRDIVYGSDIPFHYRIKALAAGLAEAEVSPALPKHLRIVAVFTADTLMEPFVGIYNQPVFSGSLLYSVIAPLIGT